MLSNLPEGVHFLKFSQDKVAELWMHFQSSRGIFDDITQGDISAFLQTFNGGNVWLELDDALGVLYATNVIIHLSADVHIAFWDHKIRERYPLIVACLAWITNACDLAKVNASLPDFTHVARKHVVNLGFKEEGVIRRFSRSNNRLYDLHLYGILKEEVITHPLLKEVL